MIIAIFETPNYEFRSYAETKEESFDNLCSAWHEHSNRTGADPNYLLDFSGDIFFVEVQQGHVYIDDDEDFLI